MNRAWLMTWAAGCAAAVALGHAAANGVDPEGLTARPLAPSETQAVPGSAGGPAQPLPTNSYLRRVTLQAIEDLASRLQMPAERIEFLELRPMVWPDRGMGCPRPGMVYPQVQADGYLIRLRAGKREFDYHGGGDKPPFLCENGG